MKHPTDYSQENVLCGRQHVICELFNIKQCTCLKLFVIKRQKGSLSKEHLDPVTSSKWEARWRPHTWESTGRELGSGRWRCWGGTWWVILPCSQLLSCLLWPHPEVCCYYTPRRSLLPSKEWLVVIDSGRPPWSGVWRAGLSRDWICQHTILPTLSLCCVIGQIRNVCGFRNLGYPHGPACEKMSLHLGKVHSSLNECRLGPERQLSSV